MNKFFEVIVYVDNIKFKRFIVSQYGPVSAISEIIGEFKEELNITSISVIFVDNSELRIFN